VGLNRKNVRKHVGIDIHLGEANYVRKEEILPNLLDDYMEVTTLNPITQDRLKGFINGKKTWEDVHDFQYLLKLKDDFLGKLKSSEGVYSREKDEVYVADDTINTWTPYFKDIFGERWEDELNKYKELVELHEFSHKTHYDRCPKFDNYNKDLKKRRSKLIDDIKKNSIIIKSKGNTKIQIPKEKAFLEKQWKDIGQEAFAAKILKEGFAYWCVKRFYENNKEYKDVGKIYDQVKLGSKTKNTKFSSYVNVVDELYRQEGDMINALDRELDTAGAAKIVKRAKELMKR